MPEMCHCGKPLHYTNLQSEAYVRRMIARCGETVVVNAGGRKWKVPRHYIALHGLRAEDVPNLGFKEITE